MNAYLLFDGIELWHVAGWTMLHFLWMGTFLALFAGVLWMLLRRAGPNARYVTAVAMLVLLAAMPLGIASWLMTTSPLVLTTHSANQVRGSDLGLAQVPIPADDTGGEIIELSSRDLAVSDNLTSPARSSSMEPSTDGGQFTTLTTLGQSQESTTNVGDDVAPQTSTVVETLDSCVPLLPWVWLVGTPITFALLATGMVGIRRLRRVSRVIDHGPLAELLTRLADSLRVGKRVSIAVCERIAAPVLVGILRPIILLPPAALTGWSPEEIEMVLMHELAHVRRWDNAVNLTQRIIESLLFFHPAVWVVSNWIRREREACCDALVVSRTNRPHAYAELLLALAAQMPRSVLFHTAASSAMAAGPLRKRIRRILQLEDDPMLVSGKSFALVTIGLLFAPMLALLNLPSRGNAENSSPQNDVAAQIEAQSEIHDEPTSDSKTTEQQDTVLDNKEEQETLTRHLSALSERLNQTEFALLEAKARYNQVKALYDKPSDRVYLLEAASKHQAGMRNMDLESQVRQVEQVLTSEHTRWGEGHPRVRLLRESYTKLQNRLKKQQEAMVVAYVDGLRQEYEVLEHKCNELRAEYDREAKAEADQNVGERISEGPTRFPSLEDQRLADLAYRRLELELEPIGDADLQRVKALGYDGGVKVTQAVGSTQGRFQPGDILVGLHVWPTTNMKDVAEVLNRDDLAELNPLKYYVVRQSSEVYPEAQNKLAVKDYVATGRISVNIGSRGSGGGGFRRISETTPSQPASSPTVSRGDRYALPAGPPVGLDPDVPRYVLPTAAEEDVHPAKSRAAVPGMAAPLSAPATKSTASRPSRRRGAEAANTNLRFEGKTFDEWREAWRTELSTEKRIEAVKALAAFGANGYGREAAEAVLEIAKQYDWQEIQPGSNSNKLQNRVLEALFGGGDSMQSISAEDWFPIVMEGIQANDKSIQQLARWILRDFNQLSGDLGFATESLLDITRTQQQLLRRDALVALAMVDRQHTDARVVARLKELLKSEHVEQVTDALNSLRYASAPLPFDGTALLFHPKETVRRQARRVIHYLRPEHDGDIVEFLLGVIEEPDRVDDHVAAIRALGLLGRSAMPAYATLEKMVMDRDKSMPARIAASKALERITGDGSVTGRLRQDVVNENSARKETPEFRMEFKQLEQALQDEERSAR